MSRHRSDRSSAIQPVRRGRKLKIASVAMAILLITALGLSLVLPFALSGDGGHTG